MLLNGGELDGVRILKAATVRQMTTNALPPDIRFAGGLRRDWRFPVFGFFTYLRRFHTSLPIYSSLFKNTRSPLRVLARPLCANERAPKSVLQRKRTLVKHAT
jgi:hypothetical protein